jgi:hypothetical protein|tara:strand:- start:12675 stop:12839 length:165 start_codon:yes stop_codon:yes gene_type:complete
MYAGYYPMGLSLERSFKKIPDVPLRHGVWLKLLRDNAIKALNGISKTTLWNIFQ